MFYVTRDSKDKFSKIEKFCYDMNTTKDDVLIVLENPYHNTIIDDFNESMKESLAELPVTFLFVPMDLWFTVDSLDTNKYKEITWNGSTVLTEEKYPSIMYTQDGGIFNLNGQSVLVVGKANFNSCRIKIKRLLRRNHYKLDTVLSYFGPSKQKLSKLPDNEFADTCKWLYSIERKLKYSEWYYSYTEDLEPVSRYNPATNKAILINDFCQINSE